MDDWMQPAELLLEVGSEDALARVLDDRLTVGKALGVLMQRHQIDEAKAMEMLTGDALKQEMSLSEAARSVVDSCSDIRPLA